MKKPQEILFECSNYTGNINNMRLDNKWCDVTIRVDGQEFRAHKNILAANLKYFDTTLSHDCFQKSNDAAVNVECVKATDLEAFIVYAYTGKILLTERNALDYLKVAHHLDEDAIKEACIEFLKRYLNVEGAFRAYKFASSIGCVSLKDAAKRVVLSNFPDCSRTLEYLSLDVESLGYLLSDVNINSVQWQECLFKVLINWIMYDFEGRKNCMKDLLALIDMKQLTADYLLECFRSVTDCIDVNYKIIEDIMDHYENCARSRKTKSKVEDLERALVVMGKTCDAESYVQFYNFAEEKWSRREGIPQSSKLTDYSNCAVMNDKVYYIAKSSGTNHLHAFDLATMRNTSLHSSSIILSQTAVCTYGKFLYFYGGVTRDKSRSDQVLRYDVLMDVFENLPPMKIKRAGATAIVYQDCLHISGGTEVLEINSILNSVEKYDSNAKKWKKCASMHEPRLLHAMAVLDGKLYACGGTAVRSNVHTKINCVEFYEPTSRSWWRAAGMKKPRAEFLVIAREGKLLAIGGDEERTVEVYDQSKDRWQMDDEMSAGLQILYLRGGFITAECLASAAIKILFKWS